VSPWRGEGTCLRQARGVEAVLVEVEAQSL